MGRGGGRREGRGRGAGGGETAIEEEWAGTGATGTLSSPFPAPEEPVGMGGGGLGEGVKATVTDIGIPRASSTVEEAARRGVSVGTKICQARHQVLGRRTNTTLGGHGLPQAQTEIHPHARTRTHKKHERAGR